MGAARLEDLAWWWCGGPMIHPICLPQGLSAQNTGIDSPGAGGATSGRGTGAAGIRQKRAARDLEGISGFDARSMIWELHRTQRSRLQCSRSGTTTSSGGPPPIRTAPCSPNCPKSGVEEQGTAISGTGCSSRSGRCTINRVELAFCSSEMKSTGMSRDVMGVRPISAVFRPHPR
jgi:hypothetical protein